MSYSKIYLFIVFLFLFFASCTSNKSKSTTIEICSNGIDDDEDGFIDYEDSDCY